ncbi:MAG TPA: hypothetical protein PKD91_06570 [Bacteroidia bacterium]|nr:hypothetical protein [Bacteroidia bacterium]
MAEALRPIDEVITEWLAIAVERFQQSIKEKKIGVTKSLFNSFITNILSSSGGNISRVEIQFLFYGRYIDMGVGRGFPIGGRRTNKDFDRFRSKDGRLKQMGRKPKKWYSKTRAYEVGQLTRLLAEQYGMQTAKSVETALDGEKFTIEL